MSRLKVLPIPADFPRILIDSPRLEEAAAPDVEFLTPRIAALFEYFGIDEGQPDSLEQLLFEMLQLFPGCQPPNASRRRGAHRKDVGEMIRFHERIQTLYLEGGLSPAKRGDQRKLLKRFKGTLEEEFPRFRALNANGVSRENFVKKCSGAYLNAQAMKLLHRLNRDILLRLARQPS